MKQDLAQAITWYKRAVAQGDAQAQNNLAVCYHAGRGVEKDEERAMVLLKAAAAQGLEMAQSTLQAVQKWNEQQATQKRGLFGRKSKSKGK